jgi:hypothetical protein
METIRSERLARERANLISQRKRTAINLLRRYKFSMLPWSDVMPEPADFCSWGTVRRVLELPSEVVVQEETFAEVAANLPQLVEEWRMRINSELLSQFKAYYEMAWGHNPTLNDKEVAAKLNLATTVFRCRACDQSSNPPMDTLSKDNPLFYPKVLGHECLTKPQYPDEEFIFNDDFNESTMQIWLSGAIRRKWTVRPLELDVNFGAVVGEIILACGLDTATTTAMAMDDLDPRLWCWDCIRRSETDQEAMVLMAFGWRSAVNFVLFCSGGAIIH